MKVVVHLVFINNTNTSYPAKYDINDNQMGKNEKKHAQTCAETNYSNKIKLKQNIMIVAG